MKKKIFMSLALLTSANFLFAENILSYKGECYVFNTEKGEYVLQNTYNYDVNSFSIDDVIDKLQNGINKATGLGCDRFIVYYTTPQKDKTLGVTIQKMAKPVNPLAKTDFVTVNPEKQSYFIGISSKLQGAGVGYWFYRGLEVGENKTDKHVFFLEKINWPYFFAKYIKEYCKQTNGSAPYIIYNQMAFLNATGEIAKYLSDHPDASINSINTSNVPALKLPGFFKISAEECTKTLPEIEEDLREIKTYKQTGSQGYSYNLYDGDSDRLFEEDGFVINYPYIDFSHIDQIMGEFFTTFMFVNNIPRGTMFSDTKIHVETHHWKTGKWPRKTRHSKRIFNAYSESYDIVYAQYIQPFGSYSFTKDWSNIDLSYVASVNNLPAYIPTLVRLTPDNHQITHVFKKGGEISDIGSWHKEYHVRRRATFNFVKLAISIAAIGALGYFGAPYLGALGVGTNIAAFVTQISTTPFIFGTTLATPLALKVSYHLGYDVVATISRWSLNRVNRSGGDNTIFDRINKDLKEDTIASSSILIQQVQTIPNLLGKLEPKDIVSPKVYKVLLKNTPTLGIDDRVIPEDEFLKDYGTYFSMFMYANHRDLGKNFYNQSEVESLAKEFVKNMQLKATGDFMQPKDAIIELMRKEWKGD